MQNQLRKVIGLVSVLAIMLSAVIPSALADTFNPTQQGQITVLNLAAVPNVIKQGQKSTITFWVNLPGTAEIEIRQKNSSTTLAATRDVTFSVNPQWNSWDWDGRDASGNFAAPAVYQAVVSAKGPNGKLSYWAVDITLLDQVGNSSSGSTWNYPTTNTPATSGLPANPPQLPGGTFNPTQSGQATVLNSSADPSSFQQGTSTTFKFWLNLPAQAEIEIRPTGSSISLPATRDFKFSASEQWNYKVWDGRDMAGNLANPGDYTAVISAVGPNGKMSYQAVAVTIMGIPQYNNPSTVNIVSVVPSVLAANVNNAVVITYTLSNPSDVSMTLAQTGSSYTLTSQTVSKSATYAGSNTMNWQSGALSSGSYVLTLSTGSSSSTASITVGSAYNPPVQTGNGTFILNHYASPNPYDPMTQGNLKVYYTLNSTASVTVSILKDGNTVRVLKNGYNEYGNSVAVWDGRLNDTYTIAPSGNYTYKIIATGVNGYGGNDVETGSFWVGTSSNNGYYNNDVYVNFAGNCGGFIDVNPSSAYCRAVEEMKKLGIFSGYDDGTFRPNKPINRAETVKVVLLTLKYTVMKPSNFTNVGFSDVNSFDWYTPYLMTARAYGVIDGYPDGTFKPANTVNRAEMIKIMIEALNLGFDTNCFKPYQDNTGGKWYSKYACASKKYWLVDPVEGKFDAARQMTRGDVANMIYRAQVQGLLTNLPPNKPMVNQYWLYPLMPTQVSIGPSVNQPYGTQQPYYNNSNYGSYYDGQLWDYPTVND